MPSIQRPLSGDPLLVDLAREHRIVTRSLAEGSGHTARTLVKEGPLRVTMVVLGVGGELREHSAPGPITIQVLEGEVRFTAHGTHHDLGEKELLALGAGTPHSVSSAEGGTFLLTLLQLDPDRSEG
jgi:quercetin dioxygenase-like cupin family protein